MNNEQILREMNEQFTEAENRGDGEWLASRLAPKLAFQRVDGTVDDRSTFLQKVKSGGERRNVSVGPIDLVHPNRAIVQCIVEIGHKQYHNLRLFVRRDGHWKLLGWANEEVQR